MSKRYPGGFIFRSNPTIVGPTNGEGGSAPGVWTLEQASYYTKLATWPQPIFAKGIYSWGRNNNGVLGQNNTIDRCNYFPKNSILHLKLFVAKALASYNNLLALVSIRQAHYPLPRS